MRVLYVSTISNTINSFLIPHIVMLIKNGYKVDIACNVDREIDERLIDMGCKVHQISFTRNISIKKNYTAYKQLLSLMKTQKYEIVHTHTPIASAIVRLVCKNIPKAKVIYTAHGFHFYKGAPFKNWLFYYNLEKYLARYTDIIITINKEDYERAQKKFNKSVQVEYLPSVGLDVENIQMIDVDRKSYREKLKIPLDAFVILSVGELSDNKNHEVIINAIKEIDNKQIYYLIAGEGVKNKHLKDLAKKYNIEDKIKVLGYRRDVIELCKISDLFAFPSKREGLGMAALEALATGLPLITSNVHGIKDYSRNGITGYNTTPDDVDGFKSSIVELYENRTLRLEMEKRNKKIVNRFDLNLVLEKLLYMYLKLKK